MNIRRLVIVFVVVNVCAGQGVQSTASEQRLAPTSVYAVNSQLKNDKGKVAKDISGIACMPPSASKRLCVVIDDDGRNAQFATLEGATIAGGQKVPLIGKEPSETTVGQPPKGIACKGGIGKFKELDGEGVAIAKPYFYIAGSHGCSRKKAKFRLSTFILARFQVDDAGRVLDVSGKAVAPGALTPAVAETTYRLSEALRAAPGVGIYFGQDLMDENGLNVEAVAIAGDRLIAGLRAPVSEGGRAFLVSVSIDYLFAKDEPSPPRIDVTALPLGNGTGIRGLARLDDGRLLILVGPAQGQDAIPYSIWLTDLVSSAPPQQLGTLEAVEQDGESGKAEGILILGAEPNELRVGVLFDGLPNGAMRGYRVPLR